MTKKKTTRKSPDRKTSTRKTGEKHSTTTSAKKTTAPTRRTAAGGNQAGAGNRPVRVAFIGAGRFANIFHYPSLASFDDVEIVGISDLDENRLEQTADKYHVRGRYTDYQRMIDETAPDAVYAVGPPHVMFDVWVWCLSQGCNLYIEKPMGLGLHQARCLLYLAEENRCITQVGFQRRACPLLVRLRDECLARGPITHALCRFYKHGPEPMIDARDRMLDDCVHCIDTLRWVFEGQEVVGVDSASRRVGTPDINFISATLHFESGATGHLLSSWSSGRRVFDVEIHAPGICVEIDPENMGMLYENDDADGVAWRTREVAGSADYHVYAGFAAKNREFIDAVRKGVQPSSGFEDAIKTMTVAETIMAQAHLREG